MSDPQNESHQHAGQYPHTPGQDPAGSGEPRLPGGHTGLPEDNPAHNTAPDGRYSGGQDAPLGGDANTEDQLEADTAVEADALKSLDPDDTPA
ncbi:hypothetical protein L2X99_17120 [Microbacterium sp. KUDC0406]|uniref:hypothetical protein n=1 Tax=Microbacterium sp. KUDC0406 TaxID=2909588 RepID=UPI001F390EA6|nr:hypothetical protein [Microbacterium sp. KUDC0406]UJP10050.1 hypothetical protein L2X99_17120 [Microbacterium sp. KUDC0406]